MPKEPREILRKLRVFRHAEETGHVAKTNRYCGISRSSFYCWCQAYADRGEAGLINAPPTPTNGIPIECYQSVKRRCLPCSVALHLEIECLRQ